ncbi:MAG: flavin reductase family protein [Methylococcaceae bacterium]|nr:flavin reductase family protein [Methylococcaceae bacterium]
MSDAIAKLFRSLTHGVYVIGVNDGERHNAFTAAWLCQVAFDPLLLALSVNPGHSSWKILKAAGRFSVNVLGSEQIELAAHFGKPAAGLDKLASVPWHYSARRMPILDDALAWLECAYSHETEAGDHVVVIARVIAGEVIKPDAIPLGYRETGDLDGSSGLYPESF